MKMYVGTINKGLLLRRDFHTLFDRGYITLDKNLTVEVSHRIKEDFGSDKEYYAHHGIKLVILPDRKEQLQEPYYLRANRGTFLLLAIIYRFSIMMKNIRGIIG